MDTTHMFQKDDGQVILCSSFYPYYHCQGSSGNRIALTTSHTELDDCMQQCADMEESGCCERTSNGCNFVAGGFDIERAQSAQTTVAFCEPAQNLEVHDDSHEAHSKKPGRWSYSYQYSYDYDAGSPDACECVDDWTSPFYSGCDEEVQHGCSNCDGSTVGDVGWCYVTDDACATSEQGHGEGKWSYCTIPHSPNPPPPSTARPPPPPPSPRPPPRQTDSSGATSLAGNSGFHSVKVRRSPPPPMPPPASADSGGSVVGLVVGLVGSMGLCYLIYRWLKRYPILRLMGMRRAANDLEVDLSLRPSHHGSSDAMGMDIRAYPYDGGNPNVV